MKSWCEKRKKGKLKMKMTRDELDEILDAHKKWLNGEKGGICADLHRADLKGTNLSGAKGLLSAIDYMQSSFERTNDGYIVYKTFCEQYASPENWEIRPGSVLTENVNFDRTESCGCGINVAPLKWVRKHYNGEIWRCLIRWEWLPGVCVPYHTGGKIRCERVELLEVVK